MDAASCRSFQDLEQYSAALAPAPGAAVLAPVVAVAVVVAVEH